VEKDQQQRRQRQRHAQDDLQQPLEREQRGQAQHPLAHRGVSLTGRARRVISNAHSGMRDRAAGRDDDGSCRETPRWASGAELTALFSFKGLLQVILGVPLPLAPLLLIFLHWR